MCKKVLVPREGLILSFPRDYTTGLIMKEAKGPHTHHYLRCTQDDFVLRFYSEPAEYQYLYKILNSYRDCTKEQITEPFIWRVSLARGCAANTCDGDLRDKGRRERVQFEGRREGEE